MSKSLSFLRLKIYQRTFLLYVVIVAIFMIIILGLTFNYIAITAQNNFSSDAVAAFVQSENQIASIRGHIDSFFTRLYASPHRLNDFFNFFGAEPSEYESARLDSAYTLDETYLQSCNSLIMNSNYTIRHMLYYTPSNMVDMEYNESGYSRQSMISPDEAEQIRKTGSIYTKDIHLNSNYMGKISFVLDVSIPLKNAFCTVPKRGICLFVQGSPTALGDLNISQQLCDNLLHCGKDTGIISNNGNMFYYNLQTSDAYAYTAIYFAPVYSYLRSLLVQFFLMAAGLILVFSLITFLLIRQFSRDTAYINNILQSMTEAQKSNFQPVDVGNRKDEFADIASHLNSLYQSLDTLIQKEYKLTISQQKAQMEMLSVQLNPHFLYNTLERIRMRAVLAGDTEVASATADLGLLYRNIVKTEPVITVARETEITRQYLDLMTFLYGDSFLYHFDVDDDILEVSTPKIWMQPIMENFFKHNFQQNDDTIKVIVLTGQRIQNGIEFRFFDNLGAIEPERLEELNRQIAQGANDSPGIGLPNIYHRLHLYYGSRITMTIKNNNPSGVCIVITVKDEDSSHVPSTDC